MLTHDFAEMLYGTGERTLHIYPDNLKHQGGDIAKIILIEASPSPHVSD